MTRILLSLIALSLALGLQAAGKGTAPPPEQRVKPAVSAVSADPREVRLAPEQEKTWEFFHQPGTRTLLKLKNRQVYPAAMGGFNYQLGLKINGKPLTTKPDRATRLLIDRPEAFTMPNGKVTYYETAGHWLSLYSNAYTASPARYGIHVKDPYTYVFDLTPIAKTGANILSVRNRWSKAAVTQYKRAMEIAVIPEFVHEPNAPSAAARRAAVSLPGFSAPTGIQAAPDGAFEILGTGTRLRFSGAFSEPGGGFNRFGSGPSAAADWQPQVRQRDQRSATVSARSGFYAVERKIESVGNRVKIADTFRNPTVQPVGIRYRQALEFTTFDLPQCRMGGNPSCVINHYPAPYNPTIFYAGDASGVGMVLEDDVSRNHALFFYDDQTRQSGFYDDAFMLEPGAEYTVKWSVYVTPDADYYTFINQIRRDWNANYTIQGPFYFVGENEIYRPREALRRQIAAKKARYVSFWEISTAAPLPEADCKRIVAMGAAIRSEFLAAAIAKRQAAIAQWRERFPQIRLSSYYHSFFQGFERPGDPAYQDSWITNADGTRQASVYSDKIFFKYQSICPIPGNRYWPEHLKNLDFLFDTLKVDWLYWDESTGPGLTAKDASGAFPINFNARDGHTALIDRKTNRILQPGGMIPLLARPAIAEGIRRSLKNSDGVVLFNSAATTAERIQPRVYAMTETQDHLARAYEMHLNTPLVYGFGNPSFSAIVERLQYGCLYLRTNLGYRSDAVSKFFPFTPEEIHEGWLKGRERIVTNRSGQFGWDGAFQARIWQYDARGDRSAAEPEARDYRDRADVKVPPGGLSILERTDSAARRD